MRFSSAYSELVAHFPESHSVLWDPKQWRRRVWINGRGGAGRLIQNPEEKADLMGVMLHWCCAGPRKIPWGAPGAVLPFIIFGPRRPYIPSISTPLKGQRAIYPLSRAVPPAVALARHYLRAFPFHAARGIDDIRIDRLERGILSQLCYSRLL